MKFQVFGIYNLDTSTYTRWPFKDENEREEVFGNSVHRKTEVDSKIVLITSGWSICVLAILF